EEAGSVIGVRTRPAKRRVAAADVPHRLKIADAVILVVLSVCAHSVPVPWMRQANTRHIAVGIWNRSAIYLDQVLAPSRIDQPVDGIVGIVGAWFDPLVFEIDSLLGSVLDVCDIARGVVGVVQVLQAAGLAWGRNLWRGDSGRRWLWIVAVFG